MRHDYDDRKVKTNKKLNTPLGYEEKQDALSVRIDANKRFSNFSLEAWCDKHLPFKAENIILDIGCGKGNLFPSYSKKLGKRGVIVGVDQSNELLSEAMECECATSKVLLEWNMNKRFPFIEKNFDYIISTFSIYYVDDVQFICGEIKRLLKTSGEVFLIGPTDNNAKELYAFNKKVFNTERDEKIIRRTNRIEREFLPFITTILGEVSVDKIPSKLVFPDETQFIRYYLATLLFEESVEKTGFEPDAEKLSSFDIPSLEVSKEMIILRGKKHE